MRRMLAMTAACLLLCELSNAQSKVETSASSPVAQQAQAKSLTPAEAAEVEESRQLSAKVVALYGEGKYEEAVKPAQRALEIRERILGPENDLTANALGNLATLQLAQNNFKAAEPLYQRLLSLYEKRYGADALKVAQLLDALAFLRYVKGDNAKTESYYQRSLSIRERAAGAESQETAQALYNLAEFYQATDNYAKADPLYKRLVAIREKTLGPKDEQTVEALDRYSCLMLKSKRKAEAAELEERAFGESWSATASAKYPKPAPLPPVESGLLNGKAISMPKPPYPAQAREQHVSGLVTVRVFIDERGKVIRACAMEGPSLLRQVSEHAALQSAFTPTKLSGQPIRVTGVLTYRFVL